MKYKHLKAEILAMNDEQLEQTVIIHSLSQDEFLPCEKFTDLIETDVFDFGQYYIVIQ